MIYTLNKPRLSGKIRAISSKSEAHRELICAALSDKPTQIICTDTNRDIDATVSCLNSLGATIIRNRDTFNVNPIKKVTKHATLDCGESGSTLRFIIPVAAALEAECKIIMHGRLPLRPLSPMYELISEHGVSMSPVGTNPFYVGGKLKGGAMSIAANVSSQFISGLLFALPLCGDISTLKLTENAESFAYTEMTLDALRMFGANINYENKTFYINPVPFYISPEKSVVGGDWSNAAFFLCAGAVGTNPVTVSGLDIKSPQGDKEILNILKRMGADINIQNGNITVTRKELNAADIDASQIPDLVPIIAVTASVARGRTKIYNASRLRLKESDRIESVCNLINSLGGHAVPTHDGMLIDGMESLYGGRVNSYNDHRIAMSAAVAATVCKTDVIVDGMEAVEKSYPSFIKDFEGLCIK